MIFRTLILSLVCGSLLVASSGCTSMSAGKLISRQTVVHATADNPVVRMVCLWEPSEGRDLQGLPRRGLLGQIMFFTAGSDSPVVVDGNIKIYQFDNHGPRESWDKPVYEFNFTPEQWSSFLQPGMLGPQYNVFIPYMRKHAERVNVALQLRFTPQGGSAPLYSQTTNTALPGIFRDEEVAELARKKFINRGASKEQQYASISELLGTLPANQSPINSQSQSGAGLSVVEQTPRSDADAIAAQQPQITTVNYSTEEELDSEEPEPPRKQFKLSPAR